MPHINLNRGSAKVQTPIPNGSGADHHAGPRPPADPSAAAVEKWVSDVGALSLFLLGQMVDTPHAVGLVLAAVGVAFVDHTFTAPAGVDRCLLGDVCDQDGHSAAEHLRLLQSAMDDTDEDEDEDGGED
jgi:hypothetical protein